MLAFWIAYGIAHAALRLSVSRTLTIDDARANELTQNFALGYQVRQPPLYEWILWSVQQVLGPGLESHLVVRYSLIALIGVATFGAVQAAVKDARWAAAASLSLVFTYPVGWTFHEWATQTLLLCAACMLTVHAALLFFERPGAWRAAILGGALAFGLYAKFSFPLFAGGLLLAALSLKETRQRLADARLLIALAVAALAFSPYLVWLWQVQGDVVSDLSGHLVKSEQSHAARAAYGLWRLLVSVVTFLLPWLAVVALAAPQAFLRAPAGAPPPSLAERLVLRAMILAALAAAAGIAAAGATNIAARYMHPILFVAPVYVFARVARLAADRVQPAQFAALAAAVALVILGVRFVAVTDNPLTRGASRGLLIPYAGLADALAARGLDRGTVASPDVREAGNLRAFLPHLRVVAGDSLRVRRPPLRGEAASCTLVWAEGDEAGARHMAGAPLAAAERIEIAARPAGLLASRAATWFALRLDPQSPACR